MLGQSDRTHTVGPTSWQMLAVTALALLTTAQAASISSWALTTDPDCSACCTAGGTFTSIQFAFSIPGTISGAGGNYITITASASVFAGTNSDLTTGCSGTCIMTHTENGGTAIGTNAVVSTTATAITITPGGSQSIASGAYVLKIKGAAMAAITASNTAVTFSVDDPSGGVITATTGLTGYTPDAGSSCGDPLTFFHGKRTKFWIPFGYFTPLLKNADVHILAKPIPGLEEDHQWFGSVQLTLPTGLPILEVTSLLKMGNMSDRKQRFFRSRELDFELLDDRLQLTRTRDTVVHGQLPKTMAGRFGTPDGKIRGFVYKHGYGHGGSADIVYVKTPSISFSIMSSIAGHEFPGDPVLQEKYRHLDLGFLDAPEGYRTFGGLLPELWGEIPRSEEARIMTIAPSNRSEAENILVESKVWANPSESPFKICSN